MKKLILSSLLLALATVSENAYTDWPYAYVPYGGPNYGLSGSSVFNLMPLGASRYPSGYFSPAQLSNILGDYRTLAQGAISGFRGIYTPYTNIPCAFCGSAW